MFTSSTKHFYSVVLLAFLALILNALIPVYSLYNLQGSADEVFKAKDQIEILDSVLLNMLNTETGARGFVITGNPVFLEPYFSGQQQLDILLPQFKRAALSDKDSINLLPRFESLIATTIARAQYVVSTREMFGFDKAAALIISGEGKKRMDAVRAATAELRFIETRKLKNLEIRQRDITKFTNIALFFVTIIDLLLFSFAFVFLFKTLKTAQLTEHRLNLLNIETLKKGELLAEKNRLQNIQARLNEVLQTVYTHNEAYAAIGNYCSHIFANYSGALYIKSNSKDYFENKAHWGNIEQVDGFEPSACWAVRRNTTYHSDHLSRDLPCRHNADIKFHLPSLCIPVASSDEMLGILSLLIPDERSNDAIVVNKELETLALEVVGQIGLAITNLRLRETLKNSAIIDVLTGLFNRRYLNETLVRELSRSDRAKVSLGVIMLDIDHFKMFNDSYGHEAGDLVLKEVGLLLKKSLRTSDIACRYGGEEFVLILPETNLEITKLRAEAILENIKAINLIYGGIRLPTISASIGISMFPDNGVETDHLLKTADDALYQAKDNGRDQIHVYCT